MADVLFIIKVEKLEKKIIFVVIFFKLGDYFRSGSGTLFFTSFLRARFFQDVKQNCEIQDPYYEVRTPDSFWLMYTMTLLEYKL